MRCNTHPDYVYTYMYYIINYRTVWCACVCVRLYLAIYSMCKSKSRDDVLKIFACTLAPNFSITWTDTICDVTRLRFEYGLLICWNLTSQVSSSNCTQFFLTIEVEKSHFAMLFSSQQELFSRINGVRGRVCRIHKHVKFFKLCQLSVDKGFTCAGYQCI